MFDQKNGESEAENDLTRVVGNEISLATDQSVVFTLW